MFYIAAPTPSPMDITSTVSQILVLAHAPSVEYTDAQFHADLENASAKLDQMEEDAIKEHNEGKTIKFPA